jgi:hypothetical protein
MFQSRCRLVGTNPPAFPEKDLEDGKQSENELDHETTVVTPFKVGDRNLTIRP